MANLTRFFTLMILVLAVGTLVPGCTGLGGSSSDGGNEVVVGALNVVLDYTNNRVSFDGEEVDMKLPDAATQFRIELLDQNSGAALFTVTVDRTPNVSQQVVTLQPIPVGTYNVRVTAFDVNGNVLGVFLQAATVQAGTNSVTVATVTPTASPSASPTASPSPSPSPTGSPTP